MTDRVEGFTGASGKPDENSDATANATQQSVEKTAVTPAGNSNVADGDIEKILEEKARLDSLFADKFTKFVTVMFTDLNGSTTIAENEGDMVSRMLIKAQNDILLPAIKENHGIFVKSIGDGSLSHFENALDALRAAVHIQKGMDALNMSKKFRFPVLMRIGMHSGKCVVEEKDIYGDVVNTASRFESAADGGGILISENTYDALSDKSEIYCRFAKQVTLKGKKEHFNAYKVFWNPREIELDKQDKSLGNGIEAAVTPARLSGNKLIWVMAIVAVVLLLIFATNFFNVLPPVESRRSIGDSAAPVDTPPR